VGPHKNPTFASNFTTKALSRSGTRIRSRNRYAARRSRSNTVNWLELVSIRSPTVSGSSTSRVKKEMAAGVPLSSSAKSSLLRLRTSRPLRIANGGEEGYHAAGGGVDGLLRRERNGTAGDQEIS